MAGLRIPEVDEALTAGEVLADLRTLWRRADLAERHELLKGMITRVYVDVVSGQLVGVTPKPAFWSLFEQVWVESPHVLLLKPEEIKRRLAEQRAAEVVLVETGGNRTPRPERVRSGYPTCVGGALGSHPPDVRRRTSLGPAAGSLVPSSGVVGTAPRLSVAHSLPAGMRQG